MPEIHLEDTIAAIATPPGEGGIGVVRLSGPRAIEIASQLFHSNGAVAASATHQAQVGFVYDAQKQPIDQVVLTVFKKPKSYTAEDVVELSAHGSSRILQKILDRAIHLGARHAEPGEFTRRAFLNGKIDLAQAEAVLDLIRAKTDRSLNVALKQLTGTLSKEVTGIKDDLMKVYAHLEAYLDFPNEDLEVYTNQDFTRKLEQIEKRLEVLIGSYQKGELLREGALVVIVGRPNVGKSSLLNALLHRDRAIVSEIPGTTRDVLEESVDLDGLWIRLVDTAGLQDSQDPLDQAGMERTKRYLAEGDLFIWMLDGSEGCRAEDLEILRALNGKPVISLVNKIDLPNRKDVSKELVADPIGLSCITGEGIDALEMKLSSEILKGELGQESILITRLRHKQALEASRDALEKSLDALKRRESLEFVAFDLKDSLNSLQELIGEIYSEDLLDVIFNEFCIGK